MAGVSSIPHMIWELEVHFRFYHGNAALSHVVQNELLLSLRVPHPIAPNLDSHLLENNCE